MSEPTANKFIDALDIAALEAKLREVDCERRAVLILLRAARARDRRTQPQQKKGEVVTHA